MSGIGVTWPNLHFFQSIQAFKPFANPVPPNTKQYQLILTKHQPVSSYTDQYHVAEWKMPAPLMCPSFSFCPGRETYFSLLMFGALPWARPGGVCVEDWHCRTTRGNLKAASLYEGALKHRRHSVPKDKNYIDELILLLFYNLQSTILHSSHW